MPVESDDASADNDYPPTHSSLNQPSTSHIPVNDDETDADGDADADADGDADAEADPDYDDEGENDVGNDVYAAPGGSGLSSKVCLFFFFHSVTVKYSSPKYGIFWGEIG